MNQGFLKIGVLKHLQEKSMSGYELMSVLEDCSGSRPSPGSMYPLLNELLEKEMISCKEEGRKKIYSLTTKGKKRIRVLFKEKKETILKNIELIKDFSSLVGEDAMRPMLKYFHLMDKNPAFIMNNINLVSELQEAVINLSDSKDFKSKEKELRKILRETIKMIKGLGNKK